MCRLGQLCGHVGDRLRDINACVVRKAGGGTRADREAALAGAQRGKEQGTVRSGLLGTVGVIVAFCSGAGSRGGVLSRGVTGSEGPCVLC